jgi:hypothetical protein
MLKSQERPTMESCAVVCRASAMDDFHYDGKTMNTLWSGIYDLKNTTARFYLNKNYEPPLDIDLRTELLMGNPRIRMKRRASACP